MNQRRKTIKKQFKTNFKFTDRKTKAKYVWLKYRPILKGKVLDVGADQCYLKRYLKKDTEYTGVGLDSDKLDLEINLEKQPLPFKDNLFDVVLCFDTLEHLDNIYEVFDELCRVSKNFVIISLPNCYSAFWHYLQYGDYKQHQHMKFYGLPLKKPEDRHKWFFASDEAERFIRFRAKKNNMKVAQLDTGGGKVPKMGTFKKWVFKRILKNYFKITCNPLLYRGTLWAVLRKNRNN